MGVFQLKTLSGVFSAGKWFRVEDKIREFRVLQLRRAGVEKSEISLNPWVTRSGYRKVAGGAPRRLYG